MFRQDRTILAGIPIATLQAWQADLQMAVHNMALGKNPQTLSYTQGDGSKSVSFNITSATAANALLQLVNRALGYPPARRPIRPYFR
jgi:hypothetical protein